MAGGSKRQRGRTRTVLKVLGLGAVVGCGVAAVVAPEKLRQGGEWSKEQATRFANQAKLQATTLRR